MFGTKEESEVNGLVPAIRFGLENNVAFPLAREGCPEKKGVTTSTSGSIVESPSVLANCKDALRIGREGHARNLSSDEILIG